MSTITVIVLIPIVAITLAVYFMVEVLNSLAKSLLAFTRQVLVKEKQKKSGKTTL
jgi:hypothetical protein